MNRSWWILLVAISACHNASRPTTTLTTEDIELTVTANGELASSASVLLGCPNVPGMWKHTITFIAPEGKWVEQDQLVLSFDTKKLRDEIQLRQSEMQTEVKNKEKTKLEDESRLEELKLEVARHEMSLEKANQKLVASAIESSATEIEKLKLDQQLATRRLALGRQQVEAHIVGSTARQTQMGTMIQRLDDNIKTLERSIEALNVKAPRSGMLVHLTSRNHKPTVGETVWLGTKQVEIPDLTKMVVEAVVDEIDANKVKLGQEVRITLDADRERIFTGSIEALGDIVHIKSWTHPYMVFDATVAIDDPDQELMRPGMKANVKIIIDQKKDAKVLPLTALNFDSGGAYVLRDRAIGGPEKVAVSLGMQSADRVQVLAGLNLGDRVISK